MNPKIHRVQVQNFKSIGKCDVRLTNLALLVGPNGSGKSNFLDTLAFIADSLNSSLEHAIRMRGGISDVRRRSHGKPRNFSLRIDFKLGEILGHYALSIGAKSNRGFQVLCEECSLGGNTLDSAHYQVEKGKITQSSLALTPAASPDHLFLVRLSGEPDFGAVFKLLSGMSFYNLVPDAIREIQPVDEGQRLLRNGGNLASVFSQLPVKTKERVIDYLGAIVPGIESVKGKTIAGRETLEFKQTTEDEEKTQTFLASNMSDGTLRALGVLVAVLQGNATAPDTLPLVGIEEPEIALHPAASGILFDILREASEDHQVIVTSHSPDLLDNDQIADNDLLSVALVDGATVIAPIDEASRAALRDKLYTPGELLRANQLSPDPDSVAEQSQMKQSFFDL
ncbi:MAG: putative ATPase [Paracoccaceae bacterium]|jgi:predicted ATPase